MNKLPIELSIEICKFMAFNKSEIILVSLFTSKITFDCCSYVYKNAKNKKIKNSYFCTSIALLKWYITNRHKFIKNKYIFNDTPTYIWNCKMSTIIASNGYLNVLKWWIIKKKHKLNHDTTESAAKFGHLHIIQWLIKNGYKWFFGILNLNDKPEIIKWSVINGYKITHNSNYSLTYINPLYLNY